MEGKYEYFKLSFFDLSFSQSFPQDKIIAGCSIFLAGHRTISGLIFSIF